MAEPVFGIAIHKVEEDARPILAADLSTIGLIGPAPQADPDTFPLNTPVRLDSNRTSMTKLLGTSGYLPDAIQGINDQLGEMQFAARCVIVRTDMGVDSDPALALQRTISNIVGSSIDGTGVFAFLKSPHTLGISPRLIAAPGYTGQMANGVGEITRATAGAGYTANVSYPLTFSGGGVNAVQATAHALGQTDGTLGQAVLDTPGAWYDSNPTIVAPTAGKQASAVAVANGGTGHAVNDVVTLSNGVSITVSTVNAGVITAATILSPGFVAYPAATPTNPRSQVTTTGVGVGATFNLTWVDHGTAATYTTVAIAGANPVCASLTSVLNQLLGHAVVESSGASQVADDQWRATINSDRLIPISGGCRVLDPVSSNVVIRPLAARILGIAVRRDNETGAPFNSWANQPVQGIIGPARDIPFALTDDANEAQELLRDNIGVLVRGEIGNEFAIASGGFVFIGTDNAGEDELWRFYNQMRGRDYIHLGLLRALRFYLGKYNITRHTVEAILTAMNSYLAQLKADEHILGYKCNFPADTNSTDEIRQGHLSVAFAAEEPAPLRLLRIQSARYRQAVDIMIADLASQLQFVS